MAVQTLTVWDAELGYGPLSFKTRDKARGRPIGAEPAWGVAQVDASGERVLNVFPHSQMEWRAAEYGIDPDDVETLLDVILHEPYIPKDDDPLGMLHPVTSKIVAATRGLPTCWTPGCSDADRLEGLQARIAAVKEIAVHITEAPQPERQDALLYVGSNRVAPARPLDPILTQTRLDPIRVASRKMAVQWERARGNRGVRPSFSLKPMSTFMGMQPLSDGEL